MPPLIKQTVASAITNNRNIASDLTANIINGVLFKANQLYNYGKNGGYPWGLPNSRMTYMSGSSYDSCKAVLEFIEEGPVLINSVLIEPDGNGDYEYTVSYYLLDSSLNIKGESKEWVYNEGTEIYPTLTLDKIEAASPYYPIIPIRLDNNNLAEDSGQTYYSEIRRACKYIGIEVQDLYDSIAQQDSDNPPEDMYVLMGTSISNNTQRTNEYLYRYFEYMYGVSKVTKVDYDYWGEVVSKSVMSPANTEVIKDSQFHAEISWSYITHEVSNTSGTKGKYSVTYVPNQGRMDHGEWVESTGGIRITWQRTATQRITYLVHGLVFRNQVSGSHWVSKDCSNAFEDPDDPENGEVFIIPLRKDICKAMGSIKAHDLMYEAIRLHVNDRYSYRVKWYETGFGKIFVMVVAIAISVIAQQWHAGTAILTAATAGIIVQSVIIAILLQPLVTMLVQDVFGEKLSLLITAIIAAYGVQLGMTQTGSIAVSTTAPTVTSIANASMTLYTGLQSIEFEDDMTALSEEQDALDELIEAQAEIEMKSAIDTNRTMNMISNDTYSMMQPHSFVQRSRWDIEKPMLLKQATEHYTSVAKFTDIPSSMIRLDVY